MIHITYTGTVDEDWINDPDKNELTREVMDSLMEKLTKSEFLFSNFSYASNPNLPKGKVIFTTLIELIPEQGTEMPGAASDK